jgi:hypothetical protein
MLRRFSRCFAAHQTEPGPISATQRIIRGVAIGAVAGGAIGLAIDLAPYDFILKKKLDELLERPMNHSVVRSHPIGPSSISNVRDMNDILTPVPIPADSEPVLLDNGEEDAVKSSITPAPEPEDDSPLSGSAAQEFQALEEPSEEVVAVLAESLPVEPVHEETSFTSESVEEVFPEPPSSREVEDALRLEIDNLKCRSEGEKAAMIEVFDRLYSERKISIELLNKLILISKIENELNSKNLDHEFPKNELIQNSFDSNNFNFFQKLVSRLISLLYSPDHPVAPARDSSTWDRLKVIHNCIRNVEAGDYEAACRELEENDIAFNWINRVIVKKMLMNEFRGILNELESID